MVACLAFGEQQHHGTPLTVADGGELRVQPAFGSTDAAGKSPLFEQAGRGAMRLEMRGIDRQPRWRACLAARAAKMRSNTPMRLQRTKRLQSVMCGP
jgi:hypothetical protein